MFFKWGIQFDENHPYEIPDQGNRKAEYAVRKGIMDGIEQKAARADGSIKFTEDKDQIVPPEKILRRKGTF